MPNTARLTGQKTFFMHIPKTGGISLSSLLRRSYQPDEICPPPAGDGRWRHKPADVAHYKLFLGHFTTDFIKAVDPGGFKLTVLRDPRDRIISTYDFWRGMPRTWKQHLTELDDDAPTYARSVNFSKFLNSELDWVVDGISNSAARQLLGSSYDYFAQDENKAVDEAWARLNKFDWFTTTEALSTDLSDLADRLGFVLPLDLERHLNRTYDYEPTANRPAISRTIPQERDLAKIDSLNAIDGALYRMAAERRWHC